MNQNESNSNPIPPQPLPFLEFYEKLISKPQIIMLWGDIGIGKSTLALQLSESILTKGKKVFYLHSKRTPLEGIVDRIFGKRSDTQKENFLFWNPDNFKKQIEIIFDWLLAVKQLETFFHEKRVGLIVIDELTGNYLPEMLMNKKNEELNDKLNFQLATLTQISQEQNIPIILTNNFTLKSDEKENLQDSPYGGKITEYWTDISIKLERTPQSGRVVFNLIKNRTNIDLPNKWNWRLENEGFTI
jgi:RecA/RadA recombinase